MYAGLTSSSEPDIFDNNGKQAHSPYQFNHFAKETWIARQWWYHQWKLHAINRNLNQRLVNLPWKKLNLSNSSFNYLMSFALTSNAIQTKTQTLIVSKRTANHTLLFFPIHHDKLIGFGIYWPLFEYSSYPYISPFINNNFLKPLYEYCLFMM